MPNENEKNELIETILTRGVETIYPSKEALIKKLAAGKPIKIYYGIDPTGPTLHIGHAVPLKKLSQFQKAGHEIVLLIGDFTAMIGDPTDKAAARVPLTREQVLQNAAHYKEQASKFLNFEGPGAAEIRYNSSWFKQMHFEDVLNLASKATVQEMLKRDMFQKRMEEGRPIYLHEFLYPLMQGYDSVALDVDAEVGGNDQTFNMLAGRDLSKVISNKEKFVVAVKLLTDPNGKKMGKTDGNMITMVDSAEDIVGKIMSWTDGMIIPGFELCTDVPTEEIKQMAAGLQNGSMHPFELKMKLGVVVAAFYRGQAAADSAKQSFSHKFSHGGLPADAPEIKTNSGRMLVDILLENKIVESKSEFRRLVADGAVTDLETNQPIADGNYALTKSSSFRIGKKRFLKIEVVP